MVRPEEIELDQADRLDVLHVELAHYAVGTFGRIQRAEIGELAGRDQHAARVHADVARQAFKLFRQLEQLAHFFFLLLPAADQRLDLPRIYRLPVLRIGAPAQRDMLPGLKRDQLGKLVAEVVAEIEHAPHVAHHRLRRHGAESHDLRHAVGAVLLPHVLDHAVAPVLAEVDVEVRHRHALGVEEALEQQVVAQRVEIGDAQRVGDERARARAAAGPDRHAVRFRPVDEVRHDQKVAGEAHLQDGLDLEFEPLLILRHFLRARRCVRIQPLHA